MLLSAQSIQDWRMLVCDFIRTPMRVADDDDDNDADDDDDADMEGAAQDYGANAFIDVDTRSCKFTSDDVLYFTDNYGSGGQWEEMGINAIYSTTKSGFRVYITANHAYRSSVPAWWANSLAQRIQWCGVGASEGPKVQAMCCGKQPTHKLYDWGGAVYTDVDVKACQLSGLRSRALSLSL